jgi:hypothetical protein
MRLESFHPSGRKNTNHRQVLQVGEEGIAWGPKENKLQTITLPTQRIKHWQRVSIQIQLLNLARDRVASDTQFLRCFDAAAFGDVERAMDELGFELARERVPHVGCTGQQKFAGFDLQLRDPIARCGYFGDRCRVHRDMNRRLGWLARNSGKVWHRRGGGLDHLIGPRRNNRARGGERQIRSCALRRWS